MANPITKLSDIPKGGFIPEHLLEWAEIKVLLPDIPAVELEFTKNGGLRGQIVLSNIEEIKGDDEQRYYADALFIEQDDKKEVCLFDASKHGWDAVECDYHFKQETELLYVKCINCSAEKFEPRISWLGYQVFDGERPTVSGSLKYRNSFDSIGIDIKCLSCGTSENILNTETA
jgi:ribosomal protein S27E